MPHSSQLFTTILVEYIQQVIAYTLIEFILSNIVEYFDFSIRGMGSRKPVKSIIFQKYNYFFALQMFFRLVCPIRPSCKG